MEGRLASSDNAEDDTEVAVVSLSEPGVVLAVGHLFAHPGSQMVEHEAGRISSALQFSGTLTDAGRQAEGLS